MILRDKLYCITDRTDTAYTIRLDPEHFIYKAHFPGRPITPGVVILQISMELLGMLMDRPLELSCIRNVKFLHVIDPVETSCVTYSYNKLQIEGDKVKVQVSVTGGQVEYAKISLICDLV